MEREEKETNGPMCHVALLGTHSSRSMSERRGWLAVSQALVWRERRFRVNSLMALLAVGLEDFLNLLAELGVAGQHAA